MQPPRWSIGRFARARSRDAPPPPARHLPAAPTRWIGPADPAPDLAGFTVLSWADLHADWILPARQVSLERDSLETPATPWISRLESIERLALTEVELVGAGAAADLLGFVVAPAAARGIELLIEADRDLEGIDEAPFQEREFGYPYSLQRLRWALGESRPVLAAPARAAAAEFAPDPLQAAAIEAGGGVVQVIAPAGSGKTAAVVQRVIALRRRGVPAATIACLTFNRAAKEQLAERLRAAGLEAVAALTFHGLAYRILADAGRLGPKTRIGAPSPAEWRRLAAIARAAAGERIWIEPAEAAQILSQIKLGRLLSAEDYAAAVADSPNPQARTMAALYTAHTEMNREAGRLDFDDLVLGAVELLREDPAVRDRWQGRYHQILLDEHQDIEPAQELIVRIVAAPHDQLFCVGDEDQVLYAFRRAAVGRIIELDRNYPGLRRFAFSINYRCPARIVEASRALIGANRVRFPKQIEPAPGRTSAGSVNLRPFIRRREAAEDIAILLATRQPGEVAVLARTTDALRPLALACADRGLAVSGRDRLFEAGGARLALQQHLRLALHPEEAGADLVRAVCRTPARGLRRGAAAAIAARLRTGDSFTAAFAGVPAPRRGRGALLAPGDLLTALGRHEDAGQALAHLRGLGGLDEWFAQGDELGGPDQFESEVLAGAQAEAEGSTPAEYLAELERQAAALRRIRREDGIELLTIHAAKGRQWPHLILLACEEGILPHARAALVGPDAEARGEGIEAERRLCYVAFTRAAERLDIHYYRDRPSRFLTEAGLLPGRRRRAPAPARGRIATFGHWLLEGLRAARD